MKNRRQFFRDVTAVAALAGASSSIPVSIAAEQESQTATATRDFWITTLRKVAQPVLTNLAANTLHERMPVEAPASKVAGRRQVTHLEAFGRTICGIAPWLELSEKSKHEAELANHLCDLARASLANATNPAAPDFLNFSVGAQPLVDTAFLVYGILRARNELWEKLDSGVREKIISAIQPVRKIKPSNSNWLLFSAMVETFLARVGAEWNAEPIEKAITSHEEWYKGDGIYGDGPEFHWDYYNSFVIQPFLIDVIEQMSKVTDRWDKYHEKIIKRALRYAAIQERLIAPDGTYPAVGRSLAYRCGAFHLLAQIALRKQLPERVAPGQARCALTAVIRRTLEAPETFDANGWLQVGICGHQPSITESYISTGSLYLCTFAFLPLGLAANDPFWSEPDQDWTSRKAWSGKDIPADHAIAAK